MTELTEVLISNEEENIKKTIEILKTTNNLRNAIKYYCETLKDKYNDKELEMIILGVHQCRGKIKNFIDELTNQKIELTDITAGIEALDAIYDCYTVSTGYAQTLYKRTKLSKNEKQEKKRAILNLIIYLAISLEAPEPYDDLLKKIWKTKGEAILNKIMVVKQWFRETLSKYCFCF